MVEHTGLKYQFFIRAASVDWDARDRESMAAGLCPLYQLLHCDVEKLQFVVYCFGEGEAYMFEKAIQTVTKYVDEEKCIMAVRSLRQRETKGHIIYDVAKKKHSQRSFFFASLTHGA
ncbi:putative retrotransposon hot spot (RHS) protein [Trypanosoma cruzi]|nr:putative retrotransposon hot spot (RHS) protein [Trypanosoma cruzi]